MEAWLPRLSLALLPLELLLLQLILAGGNPGPAPRLEIVLLWALSVLVLISGVLQPKPNEAPEAAAHTEFGLGIKSRMVGESTEMMVMEWDYFFMFCPSIVSVLC